MISCLFLRIILPLLTLSSHPGRGYGNFEEGEVSRVIRCWDKEVRYMEGSGVRMLTVGKCWSLVSRFPGTPWVSLR
eukprot:6385033-Pyramimonas_sp.AAC.1